MNLRKEVEKQVPLKSAPPDENEPLQMREIDIKEITIDESVKEKLEFRTDEEMEFLPENKQDLEDLFDGIISLICLINPCSLRRTKRRSQTLF
jgi:hypothetical protein